MSDDAVVISIGNPSLGWVVIGMRTHVAVLPCFEDGHVLGLECWCGPELEDGDGKANVPLVSHRDLGEREGLGELTAREDDL